LAQREPWRVPTYPVSLVGVAHSVDIAAIDSHSFLKFPILYNFRSIGGKWTKLGVYTPPGPPHLPCKFGGPSPSPSYSCHRLPFIFGLSVGVSYRDGSWFPVLRASP
jgi:hypothetical protein